MSSDLLREAAALMRERAEAATEGPWSRHNDDLWMVANGTLTGLTASHDVAADAEHIASWHPAVALEIAPFLEFAAAYANQPEPQSPTVQFALSIARTYLVRDS